MQANIDQTLVIIIETISFGCLFIFIVTLFKQNSINQLNLYLKNILILISRITKKQCETEILKLQLVQKVLTCLKGSEELKRPSGDANEQGAEVLWEPWLGPGGWHSAFSNAQCQEQEEAPRNRARSSLEPDAHLQNLELQFKTYQTPAHVDCNCLNCKFVPAGVNHNFLTAEHQEDYMSRLLTRKSELQNEFRQLRDHLLSA